MTVNNFILLIKIYKQSTNYINICFIFKPQHEIEAYFAKLTALLASAETRDRGLIALSHLVSRCPLEILEERLQYWVNICAKICNQKGHTASIPLACDVLSKLSLCSK